MALILAIETATKLCSVALGRDGSLLAIRETNAERNAHAEKVNVFIDEVLNEADRTLNDLDAVAVGTGPGSYTGLRIGLSAAKGLCYALDIPLIGMGTLSIMLAELNRKHGDQEAICWPMIDARRMEVFTRPYSSSCDPLADVAPLILDQHWVGVQERCVVFGDGADKATDLWSQHPNITHIRGIQPSAAAMMDGAFQRFKEAAFDDLAYLVPDYGKAANVTKPAGKRT